MIQAWTVLAADGVTGGQFVAPPGVGLIIVAGSVLFMNVWLMVYAVHLGQERGQGVYFWMLLTLFFGPLAILALWRQPSLRACTKCGELSERTESECPWCGYLFKSAREDADHQPLVPEEWEE